MLNGCKVKGSLIKGLMFYMQKKWGKAYVEALKFSYSSSEIKEGKYYPYSYIRELHRYLLEKNRGREENAFRQAGRSVVEGTLEGKFFVNYIVKRRSLEKTFADLVKAWESENFQNVFAGSIEHSGSTIRVTVDQVCDDRGEEVCWLNLGGMEGVIKISEKKARVRHTECVFHGGEHCVYEVELLD